MANVRVSISPEFVTLALPTSEEEWSATRLTTDFSVLIDPNPGAGIPVSVGIYADKASPVFLAWAQAGSEYREFYTNESGEITITAGDIVTTSSLAEVTEWSAGNGGSLPTTTVHLLIEGELYAIVVQLEHAA